MSALWWIAAALAWEEVGEGGKLTGRAWPAAERFVAAPAPAADVVLTDPTALGQVAAATAAAIRATHKPELRTGGALSELGHGLDDVLRTLDVVARVAAEDAGAPRQRLLDPAWLAEHFRGWSWRPDTAAAAARKVTVTPDRIRLTKYLVYQVQGSSTRNETFDTALYAVTDPIDARWQAHTRIDAYAGVFEPRGAAHGQLRPLVYLTREGVNRALMQGSIEVATPDGRRTLYNVHHSNGIAYDPQEKDGNRQRRYWTFREVGDLRGVEDVVLQPGVTVAGDPYNVGFGALVGLVDHDADGRAVLRLAVLADTGGAFQPNLFQLDWLAGSFPSHAAYERAVASLPRRAAASILVAR